MARVLPTEWGLAPEHLEALYGRERPRVALHFGVSQRAQGLVIETVAQNAAKRAQRRRGLPASSRPKLWMTAPQR